MGEERGGALSYWVRGRVFQAVASAENATIRVCLGNTPTTGDQDFKALKFIKSRRSKYTFADIVTNKYNLEQANDALSALEAGREIKPVIDYRGC